MKLIKLLFPILVMIEELLLNNNWDPVQEISWRNQELAKQQKQ